MLINSYLVLRMGCPGGLLVKNPSASVGDVGSIPGSEDSLEKEMATHSSILTWEIPWIEEPGRLQSMGSQRVGHSLVTEHKMPSGQAINCCSLG